MPYYTSPGSPYWYDRFDPTRSALAGMTRADLLARLSAAQNALLNFTIVGRVESVSYGQGDGNQSINYNKLNYEQLLQMIYLLQRQLGLVPARNALRPIFR